MLRDFRASLNLPRATAVAALATIGLAAPIRAQPPSIGRRTSGWTGGRPKRIGASQRAALERLTAAMSAKPEYE